MNSVIEALNNLDQNGFFKESQELEKYLIKCAANKNYSKIGLVSLVAALLLNKLTHHDVAKQVAYLPPVKKVQRPLVRKPAKLDPSLKSNFKSFLQFVEGKTGSEGYYSNDKDDSGGITIEGSSQKAWNDIREEYPELPEDVRDTTRAQRDKMTKLFYWEPLKASKLPFAVAMQLVDFRFNGGQVASKVVRAIQDHIGAPGSGSMDDLTVKAIWNYCGGDRHKQLELARFISKIRHQYYITRPLKKKKKFGKGWQNRLIALDKYIVHHLFPDAKYTK